MNRPDEALTSQIKKELTNICRKYNICPMPSGTVTLHICNGVVGTVEAVAKVTIK